MNDIESGRRHPVHSPLVERHNEPVIVFLTVCSKDRKAIFASSDVARVIIDAWSAAKSWLVGRYVMMPDHIYLFCAPGVNPTERLDQWVRYWKNVASKN
jgi:putative transposase